jgi:hypothetical protein
MISCRTCGEYRVVKVPTPDQVKKTRYDYYCKRTGAKIWRLSKARMDCPRSDGNAT